MVQNGHPGQAQTCRFEEINSINLSDVDIIAVPAIGADPNTTWTDEGFQKTWFITDIINRIQRVRILLYDHGKPSDHDDLDSLAQNLLNQLHKAREHSKQEKRPIFFICHSTGGLVAKAALVIASQTTRKTSNFRSVMDNCYGIAFFATPHQGSSYLSAPEYAKSIRSLLRLKYHLPHRLRDLLRPRHQGLWDLTNEFRAISSDMKIWTFLETVESTMNILDTDTGSTVEFHIPITSVRSGILDLEHEKETPLATDHLGTACFKGQERTARISFIKELQSAIALSLELSHLDDIPLQIKHQVTMQVNGFFEDTALGVSDETPLKLWSAKASLHDYLEKGPAECLEDRLRRPGKIDLNSLDDSSVSSFDADEPFANTVPTPEADIHDETSLQVEPILRRPSIKRSRSSMNQLSPRIHVTEAGDTNYVGPQSVDSSPAIRGLDNLGENDSFGTQDKSEESELSEESSSDIKSKRNRLVKSISSKYKGLLPVPLSSRNRSSDNRTEVPRTAPRFDRPEPGTEKLLWVHIPYTHTGWVPRVLSKACMDDERSNFMRNFMNEKNWYSNLIRARHLQPHARFVRPTCIHSRQSDISPVNGERTSENPQLALYMPYLHWDTYWNLIQRRRVIEQRLHQGRSRPVPEEISKSSLESRLIWKYLGSEPPIHFRRTLDQFGYPNLRSTVARDDDQMLWKRTRKTINLNDEIGDYSGSQDTERSPRLFTDGKVLMVDQLWLWVVDQKTVVTFFPNQEATTAEGKLYEQANLHSSIYNELNGDLARRFETAGDLAALIVLHAVTILLDRTLHHDLQILRVFEESISILTESVTKSFKRFRNRGFITKPTEYNKAPDGRTMTVAERDERERRAANQNKDDLSTLLELRDIMDELGTIMKLLDQQTAEIKNMMEYFEDKGYGRVFMETALSRLDEYRTQVSEMRENAHLAQKAVETLLDLKQKQANVDESRLARWEAEVTQDQSRAVMVFTVFTVIFLPLSFFTSLFGMNTREWSGEETNPTIGTMLAIAGPSSVAIIASALLLAFSQRLRDIVSITQKIIVELLKNFFVNPIRIIFQSGHFSKESSYELSESPYFKERFRTRGPGRYQQQQELDYWVRYGNDLDGMSCSEKERGNHTTYSL